MKADLHVHSHYSDGSDSVEAVLRRAKTAGVEAISFVDHDTVAGWLEIKALSSSYGIKAVPGIEISAYDFKRQRKVHVLGYEYHPAALHIKEHCDKLLERRHHHSLWQMEQIKAAGYNLDIDAVIASAFPSRTVYKQHIMKELTQADYSSPEYQRLYKSLFKGLGPAAGDIDYIDVFEAVKAIKADRGLAVVAHPGQLDSFELIPELVRVGLDGIERNHFDHSADDHQKVEMLAEAFGLVMTGGSDNHGTFGAAAKIGDITSPVAVNTFKGL
ncbi:PHP domain-containing protein [Planococcus sp. ISL-109]|uniref:PHP domain-containing protein n=1 Tax=Planococcus sp. ISL-109 TaxID=2819166 RepID=UPI001BE78B63|nr:PHP domain-containing protein [Planococcus sp. ISL-109]MBT2582230.1 PHP domain-containing protein [Planococcus sp. ISL-109]